MRAEAAIFLGVQDTRTAKTEGGWISFLVSTQVCVEFQLAATSRASGQFQVIRGWCCRRARAGVIVTSCYLPVPPRSLPDTANQRPLAQADFTSPKTTTFFLWCLILTIDSWLVCPQRMFRFWVACQSTESLGDKKISLADEKGSVDGRGWWQMRGGSPW